MYHIRDKYWAQAASFGSNLSCRDPDLESALVAQVQKIRDAYYEAIKKDMEISYTYAAEEYMLSRSAEYIVHVCDAIRCPSNPFVTCSCPLLSTGDYACLNEADKACCEARDAFKNRNYDDSTAFFGN